MSVLIKGAKLPKSCFGCHLFKLDDQDLWCIANHYAGCCRALSKYIDENKFVIERHPDCPLIEVPTPHGRLGDLDALWDRMYKYSDNEGAKMPFGDNDFMIHRDSACELIEDAPTVIEAEE